jgi:hypothetical protein
VEREGEGGPRDCYGDEGNCREERKAGTGKEDRGTMAVVRRWKREIYFLSFLTCYRTILSKRR